MTAYAECRGGGRGNSQTPIVSTLGGVGCTVHEKQELVMWGRSGVVESRVLAYVALHMQYSVHALYAWPTKFFSFFELALQSRGGGQCISTSDFSSSIDGGRTADIEAGVHRLR